MKISFFQVRENIKDYFDGFAQVVLEKMGEVKLVVDRKTYVLLKGQFRKKNFFRFLKLLLSQQIPWVLNVSLFLAL